MNVIVSAFVLAIGVFWAIITTFAGLLFMPIMLLMTAIGLPKNYRPESKSDNIVPDYPFGNDIEEVPQEYLKAYSHYLKSDEWKSFRKLILKRDKYRCVDCRVRAYHKDICPDGEKLQVHHIHYNGIQTMEFMPEQCVSLCDPSPIFHTRNITF